MNSDKFLKNVSVPILEYGEQPWSSKCRELRNVSINHTMILMVA